MDQQAVSEAEEALDWGVFARLMAELLAYRSRRAAEAAQAAEEPLELAA